jgi:hypothetical protein
MKKIYTLMLLVSASFAAMAQSAYTIKGNLVDSTAGLPFTSVFLLTPGDSSLVTFTRSDDKGAFVFKNLKKQDYLVKATYVGYLPYQELLKYDPAKLTVDLGGISLKPIQKELFEVVVRTAKAPINIKGDTIEYDARKFKVPPGSSVEDLLRKLPGFQLDAEGNIKAQGESVKKILVDGKRFFGDDPKVATKNLPAEAINKVQVFNDSSEQSKLTGIDDGKHEKTVNLELKEEFKKGGFGKGTIVGGSDERVMAKVNYNKFDSKNQFAVVGFGNNINQSGLSNNDYQDFKGSQSYNWNDNADFGFSLGGGVRIIYSDGDSEDEGLEIPQTWGPGQGFSKNYAGGINYNYDTKKTKVSTNYFFNQTTQTLDQLTRSQYFLPSSSYLLSDSSFNRNYAQNHRISLRVEKQIDSLNTVIFNVNSKIGNKSQTATNDKQFDNVQGENFRDQNLNNNYNGQNFIFSGALIYRHKFMKKGRNFAWSGTFNKNNNDQNALQKSSLDQFSVVGDNFPLGIGSFNINQNVLALNESQELKTSLLFIEPLSKKFSLETFYNFSNLAQNVSRDVFDQFSDNKPRVDSLSRYYENDIQFHRLGASIRYSFKGFNVAVGAAAQQYGINGKFFNQKGGALQTELNKPYFNVLPNLSINYDLKNNRFIFGNYSVGVSAPKLRDLQPFTDNSNPLYVRLGNPNLTPTTSHSSMIGFGLFNSVSFINIWTNLSFNYYQNQVVYNQKVGSDLVTTLTPENISGGKNFGHYFSFGFPIKKTKLSASVNTNVNFGRNLVYINNTLNQNDNQMYNLNLRFDLTPVEWFSMFTTFGKGLNYANYSINSTQNQQYQNNFIQSNTVIQFPKLIFLTADLNYSNYKNEKLNFNQHLPILNMSTYKILGKNKKSEVRISLYDVFKRNIGVRQSAYQNVISSSVTQTLSRYVMFTYTYNMRGVSANVKKSRWE